MGFKNLVLLDCRVYLKILPDDNVDLFFFLENFLIVGFFSLFFLIVGLNFLVFTDCRVDLKFLDRGV
jgi:hypothetical protein